MKNIVWLASYPKSGNTWFRAFLANLLQEKQDPADINQLGGGPIFSARPIFDQYTGIQSSDLLPEEIDRLRPVVYREMASKAEKTLFIKAHDAYTRLDDGSTLFPPEASRGAIYLIRNPLDVAPSFANHSSCGIDEIVREMNDLGHAFCGNPANLPNQLRQHLLGWSKHVKSWMAATEIPVHFIRYEDMKATPLETFSAAIRFAGLEHSEAEIAQALKACSFDTLSSQEQNNGFREKAAKVSSFFRKGETGSWIETLSTEQASRLLREHREIMQAFHYLDEQQQLTFMGHLPDFPGSHIAKQLEAARTHTSHHYTLYGVSISLPFAFDELPKIENSMHTNSADVTIQFGAISCQQQDWEEQSIGYKAKLGLCLLSVPGIADYLISNHGETVLNLLTIA